MFDNLYNFKKDSWHCNFWEWCYGVKPYEVFRTMCPYFWLFIGTILILPIIILFKLLRVPATSIGSWAVSTGNKCREAKQSVSDVMPDISISQTFDSINPSKFMSIVFTAIIVVLIGWLIYAFVAPALIAVPWWDLGMILLAIIAIVSIAAGGIWVLSKLWPCVVVPFRMLGTGGLMVGSMLYATYKEFCPMITWEDNE